MVIDSVIPSGGRLRRGAALLVATVLLGLLAAVCSCPAVAEQARSGPVIVRLNGDIAPLALPRDRLAPVALTVSGGVRSVGSASLPRLTRIRLAIGGRGVLSARGLPVCPKSRLRSADARQALERCGGALVGRGRLEGLATIPRQAPFPFRAGLLAFNGRRADGGPAVWAHAFSASPPFSIVLPFAVHRRGAGLGTALVIRVPDSLGRVARLSGFSLRLWRRYRYRGSSRSYLSASCPIPPRLTAGFLAFARARYAFAGGREATVEAVRSCRGR